MPTTSATTVTVTGLENGIPHTGRVRATGGSGGPGPWVEAEATPNAPPPPSSGTRDRYEHPGLADAPLNMPMGDAAQFEVMHTNITNSGGYSAPKDWSIAFFLAVQGSPTRTIYTQDGRSIIGHNSSSISWPVPAGTTNDDIPLGVGLGGWGDRHANFFHWDKTRVIEIYNAEFDGSGNISGTEIYLNSTASHGMQYGPNPQGGARGGSDTSASMGIVRYHHFYNPDGTLKSTIRIPHGLAMSLSSNTMLYKSSQSDYVFPASRTDGHDLLGPSTSGRMGWTMAIPRTTANINWYNGLATSTDNQKTAKAVVRAWLEYPNVVVDSSGLAAVYCEHKMPDVVIDNFHNDRTGYLSAGMERMQRVLNSANQWETWRTSSPRQGFGGGAPVVAYSAGLA